MNAIEIRGLTKRFGRFNRTAMALDNLDLSVPEGGVFGLLGPNGAGKTTAMRCLLGMVRADGECRILGQKTPQNLAQIIPRLGTLVEAPRFFPNFSGRKNLHLLAQIEQLPKSTVDESLDKVGLTDAGDKTFEKFSLGMKQRLGIAAALLKDPELLILDEPANGLDPAGIVEIRTMLRTLGEEGRTVLVSSHLLGEVEGMCDRVAIVSRGHTVAAGTLEEVLGRSGPVAHFVRVSDINNALTALKDAGATIDVVTGGLIVGPSTSPDQVVSALMRAGVSLDELRPITRGLEEVFMELTEGGDRR